MAFILFENDSPEILANLGGRKALLLKQLGEIGAQVPQWFCVSHTAPERFVRGHALLDYLENFAHQIFFDEAQFKAAAEAFAQEVEKRFLGCSMNPEINKEILACKAGFAGGAKDQAVAIRVSRGNEERSLSSPVFLNVVSDFEIIYDIRRAWAAAYSLEAMTYRRRQAQTIAPSHVGVIVQKMVLADLGGRAALESASANVKVEVQNGDSARLSAFLPQIQQTALGLAQLQLISGPVAFSWAVEAGKLWILG